MELTGNAPTSLLAVANWQSRALQPSEVYEPEFIEWAHHHRAFLYLVLVGPRAEIVGLTSEEDGWNVATRFYNGAEFKPRTIRVPYALLPEKSTHLVEGLVKWTDEHGAEHSANAVTIARLVLEQAIEQDGPLNNWYEQTLRKFFTYRVRYIGQSYGKQGERTAAERINEGHEHVQAELARIMDSHPNQAVALIALDANVQGREIVGTIDETDLEGLSNYLGQAISQPEGPLVDEKKLVTAAEAMLIRSFPDLRNKQYENFPLKDAPSLVGELTEAGISHLGVHLDVSQSLALLQQPDDSQAPSAVLRFGVNLKTGADETLQTSAPLSWRAT